jgi:hypothetical protein
MKSLHEGQLVAVADGDDVVVDGIVYHVASFLKAEVAVADESGGVAFRSVHRNALRERTAAGEHDEALRKEIRRAASSGRGGGGGVSGPAGGSRGHTRGADHRSTG